jgi:hypothetical protein
MQNAITKRLDALESMKSKRHIVYTMIKNENDKYRIRVSTWDGIPGSGRTNTSYNYDEKADTREAGITRICEIAAKYPATGDYTLLDLTFKDETREREEAVMV